MVPLQTSSWNLLQCTCSLNPGPARLPLWYIRRQLRDPGRVACFQGRSAASHRQLGLAVAPCNGGTLRARHTSADSQESSPGSHSTCIVAMCIRGSAQYHLLGARSLWCPILERISLAALPWHAQLHRSHSLLQFSGKAVPLHVHADGSPAGDILAARDGRAV